MPYPVATKMEALNDTVSVLSRYYIAGRYECDREATGSTERLYLGGDAYSAPMVYIRHDAGEWAAYNIGRDYLGSITQIATSDGDLVEEYSYDPWGRLHDAQTLEPYPAGQEPELFLGRGFTAHEHMQWFGLINMNARLYDPLTGRFLSPDPYIQAPDFSQNFNRYSYALNNPLKYTDESGEIVGTLLTAILRLPLAITEGVIIPFFVGFLDTAEAGRKFVSAWGDYGNRVSNAFKIDMGLFATDSNLSFVQNALSIASSTL